MKYIYFTSGLVLVFVFQVIFTSQAVFAYTTVSGNISSDTVWQTGEVYVVEGNVGVDSGASLTIQPGAIVKFKQWASLTVNGELAVNGTSDGRVYLTSFNDDSVGGDTNGDGSSAGSAGYWSQIRFNSGSNSSINYTTIRYGGSGTEMYSNLFIEGGVLTVSNSTISSSSNYGFHMAGGSATITDSIVRDNTVGIYAHGPGNLAVNGNTFIDNSDVAGQFQYSTNTITSSGNTSSGTGKNSFYVYGQMLVDNTLTGGIPYLVDSIQVVSGKTLAIDPGTVIKFRQWGYLMVWGNLNSNGTPSYPVYFTSFKDDSVGGDTNNAGGTPAGYDWQQIQFNSGSTGSIRNSVIRYGGSGFDINSNIYVNGGTVAISDSTIASSAFFGLLKAGGSVSITNSTIQDNVYGVYNYTFDPIDARNNYWGEPSGPAHPSNPGGTGDAVSYYVDFVPWLTSPPTPISGKEPVIIVPGILGSRLNRVSDGEEVWPNSLELTKPGPDLYLNQLKLDKFGNEILDINSTAILEREFLVFPFYENLIEEFEGKGYVRNSDLIIFDYDWRENISSISLELKQIIDNKAGFSPTGKVSIVAHSMGGVLTKEYLRQNKEDLSKINNIVIAGAPQLGAVKAFNLLNFGDNLNVPILNPDTAKDISQNMPSVYQLLPSQEYINKGVGYVEDRRNNQNKVLNYNETKSFMADDNRNETLLNLAEQFHQNLDNLNINGPKITNLVACNTKTLVGIKIFDNKKADIELAKGDGTVPLVSARQIFSSLNQSNYYAIRGFDHFDLVSKDQALDLISAAVSGNTIPSLGDIKNDDSLCHFDARRFFLFSTHSPVNLRVYDDQGSYVGLNEDGDVNIGIAGGDFIRVGENNFVLVPEGQDYRAVIDAYDTGSFDFKVRILSDNDKEDSAIYFDIPIQDSDLNAELVFDGDLKDILLKIDQEGDGNFESLLNPSFFIYRLNQPTIEDVIINIEGAYNLGWIENEAREYLIKRLEHVSKLQEKDESKDAEIEEILESLLTKLDQYLRGGLINIQAYGIIKEDIDLVNNW